VQEGVAIGRTFAGIRGYHIDGNKEMVAFGAMNLAGACTSCYVATGTSFEILNPTSCMKAVDVEIIYCSIYHAHF
jgi:hypothetical protein